jgi:hypothetical protein
MKKSYPLSILFLFVVLIANAQTNPVITSWLQNTATYGSYYTAATGSTPNTMTVLANCQKVQYDDTYVYVTTRGIPTYPTGIFTGDGNKNLAGDQDAMYRFPLSPTQKTGTATSTTGGNIGVLINGVSIFDYRDGVSWNYSSSSLCGGPAYSSCTGDGLWNRDAVHAEKLGFDCSKGHPAGTNYHHHQNPTAFKYDSTTSVSYSSICSSYDSDGLYTIDSSTHSPLIGFAYDGYPIYGAYGYKNLDGTGEITRMKSSYAVNSAATTRTNGPDISTTYWNGYFKEDYVYTAHTDTDYLDEHNGRYCVTPEYPDGTYAYFATVDENNTSIYPYFIGPTFYGVKSASKYGTSTTTVSDTTVYSATLGVKEYDLDSSEITVFPNPAQDYIAVQVELAKQDLTLKMYNSLGQLVKTGVITQGSTFTHIETDTLYNGIYILKVANGTSSKTFKVIISK